jgi:hypothetical protein
MYYNGMMRHGINQLGAADMAAGAFPLGSNGVNARKKSRAPCGCSPHEFRLLGQVGQESNRQPAVVELTCSPE